MLVFAVVVVGAHLSCCGPLRTSWGGQQSDSGGSLWSVLLFGAAWFLLFHLGFVWCGFSVCFGGLCCYQVSTLGGFPRDLQPRASFVGPLCLWALLRALIAFFILGVWPFFGVVEFLVSDSS